MATVRSLPVTLRAEGIDKEVRELEKECCVLVLPKRPACEASLYGFQEKIGTLQDGRSHVLR